MALAVLTLPHMRTVATDSPVIRAGERQALQTAGELVAAAQAAIAQAQAEATAAVTHSLQLQAQQNERQLQKALLLKAFSLQVESERMQRELREQFVHTQIACLQALLAGPLPAGFYERVLDSAAHWVGENSALVLCVPPSEEQAACEGVELAAAQGQLQVQVQVDPNLAPGQCNLQTGFGRVQASLPVQLEALQEALARWWQPVDAPAPAVAARPAARGV
jgi:flagellar biosynthesis/type III secretory pathway protein FliH